MHADFLPSLLLFAIVAPGLAWWPATRLPLAPAEKLLASTALSLLGIFLFAWADFVWALPAAWLWALPVLAVGSLALGAQALAAAWRDADARALLIAQLLVAAWCVGWLATIASYSGGGWAADWFEHWERAHFFLAREPLDHKFLGRYALTARPPLANVVTAALLTLTRTDFAHYQFFSTLLASLVFLPAALLARHFGRRGGAIALCAVLFMLNPLFVQNATFAWTKLPAAFFVLTALYFFLRLQARGAPRAVGWLCGASLAAGLLAHYSAGPYVVMLAAGWGWLGWPRRHEAEWRRATAAAALAGGLVLATWFAWTLCVYGVRESFLSNSSVTGSEAHQGSQLAKIALNLRDTLVPHFLRPLDRGLIVQASPWGAARDWFFQCYQLNLPLACGSVAWLAVLRELGRAARQAEARWRIFWGAFVGGVVLLGVATHGARDTWGLTHICLQALVLLALAWLAARWPGLGRGWQWALVAGATVDFAGGIALQFAVQSFALDRWLAAGRTLEATLHSYTEVTFMNFAAKAQHQLVFFSDALGAPFLAVGVLILSLAIALRRARQA